MIHHSETIQCLIEREKVIHQVFGFFLLGQDFVHIGKKGVFDAVIAWRILSIQASHLRSVPHHYNIGGALHRLGRLPH